MAPKLLAQIPLGTFNGIGGLSDNPGDIATAGARFESAITILITILTIVAGIWFMIRLLMGAFAWISSQGDKAAIQNARQTIIHAMIGLGITASSFVIINLVGYVLGFTNILSPGTVIQTLTP